MKLNITLIGLLFTSLSFFANAQELSVLEMNKFPKITLPYQTPQNLPSTKNKPSDLKQFAYVKGDVTNFLKGLKVELEKNATCYAIGQLKHDKQLLLLYLEVFKSPETSKYEFIIKMTTLKTESDKSLVYLAHQYYETDTYDDGKLYLQTTILSAKIYLKYEKLFVDSKIRMIDDLILQGTSKTKRTKDVVSEFRDVLIYNEFSEVPTY